MKGCIVDDLTGHPLKTPFYGIFQAGFTAFTLPTLPALDMLDFAYPESV